MLFGAFLTVDLTAKSQCKDFLVLFDSVHTRTIIQKSTKKHEQHKMHGRGKGGGKKHMTHDTVLKPEYTEHQKEP